MDGRERSPEAGDWRRGFRCPGPRLQPPASSLSLFLILMAGLLFFSRLGIPLQEPEEPRYAEIPRQMLKSGNFVVPVLHGLAYYDKPPLLYWLVMAAYAVFGVHDWAARLVPSAAAFLTVLLTYGWGKQVVGPRAGFAAASMLCLSARFVYLGRLLTMNSLLCLWVVAALAAAHLAVRGPNLRWRYWLLSAAACSLGLLTKGPVVLALVVVPVLIYQALQPLSARPGIGPWSAHLAVAFGLACPWYLTLAVRNPDFVDYFFWKHNVLRYVAPFDHAKPVWYYVPDLLLGMLPWSLLLLPLLKFVSHRGVACFRGRLAQAKVIRKEARESMAPDATDAPRRPQELGFFLLASLCCFLFYSLAGSKRAGYILPAMPTLALALGCYLDAALAQAKGQRAKAKASPLGLSPFPFRLSPSSCWTLCGIVTFAGLLIALHLALPGYVQKFSMRGQIRPLVEQAKDSQLPIICYPRRWDSVSFYLRRDDVRVYTADRRRQLVADLQANPRALAFIKSDHSLNELLHDLPESLEFVPRGRQGGVAVGWLRRGEPGCVSAQSVRDETKLRALTQPGSPVKSAEPVH